jgi:hypothetical protein
LRQIEEIDTAKGYWATTRIGVSFNPYQVLNPSTASPGYTTSIDESYTEQMMAYCRYTLGSRCVLENDSIRDPISNLGSTYPQMYSAMSGASGDIHLMLDGIDKNVTLGAPIAFQTAATQSKYGDFWGTLVWATQNHASSVELPVDGGYPTSGGSGAPAWQTLAEVGVVRRDPIGHAPCVDRPAGQSTQNDIVATVTVDELAAIDTAAGYGDVGSVPFDTVTANIAWPTGVQQAGLISIGGGSPATSAICGSAQASCTATWRVPDTYSRNSGSRNPPR